MSEPIEGIVVLGFPRSGTTLVRRLLDAHPEISCPPETNLLRAAARFLAEDRFGDGLGLGPLCGLGFSGIEEREIVEAVGELVLGFFRRIARSDGASLWASKSAFDVFHLDAVEALCGDRCRFVTVHRHPLDTVASVAELCRKMAVHPEELRPYVARYAAPMEGFAAAWSEATADLLRFEARHADRSVRIRYEDLVGDPAGQVRRLFGGFGLEVAAEDLVATAMSTVDDVGLGDWKTYLEDDVVSSRVGRWRSLPASLIAPLRSRVAEVASDLEYEFEDPPRVPGPEEARRRYELGIAAGRARRRDPGAEPSDGDAS